MRTAIEARYLLLTLAPCHVDGSGVVWLDRLWHRDFVAHFRYLKRIVLAAPVGTKSDVTAKAVADLVRLDVPSDVSFTLVPLPLSLSTREAVASLPLVARTLWRAIGEADVVHSGVAGWPLPIGWIANPIALARGRTLLLVVESAPWRTSGAAHERRRDRVRDVVSESIARFFVERADVSLFTHPSYAQTLGRGKARGCYVAPASWIEPEDIVSTADASASWAAKREGPVRLLFAARLEPTKGVDALLEALRALDRRCVRAMVDVVGAGTRKAACVEAAARLRHVKLRVRDPVPYGRPFLELVSAFHAVLVPNLGDEQPRVIFDAYARAVPVIAFDTAGIRAHLQHGKTGWLIARAELADAIERATRSVRELERMGITALAESPRFTHQAMHETRWEILQHALAKRSTAVG